MSSKLNYLIGVSLKRKIKTKWFIIVNILLALLLTAVINIDSIITFFGGDFNNVQKVYVITENDKAFEYFSAQVDSFEQLNYSDQFQVEKDEDVEPSYEIILYDKSAEEAKKLIEEDKKTWVLILEDDPDTILKATLITEAYINAMPYQNIHNFINQTKTIMAIEESGIAPEEIMKIYTPIELNREYLDETKQSKNELMETIMSSIFPIFILPFFMLIIILVQMIGAEVNDEKTTRGMEIIISNVSPKTHFFAKVISGNLFVLLQASLFVLFGGIGLFVRKLIGSTSLMPNMGFDLKEIVTQTLGTGIGQQLIYIIPIAVILMILTFLSYSLLAGILASMTTNTEDFQQIQTPIMLILLLGYYLAMFAGMFEGSTFIKILSYIPLISGILSPSLLLINQIGIIDVVISIIVSISFNWLLIKYGLKIYKVGILNYSSEGLWKKMFQALKD